MERSARPKVDLEEIWSGFVRDYFSITQQTLPSSVNTAKVSADIEASIAWGASRNATQAREVIARLCAGLQCFGDVLAGTATVVFGPSAHCWNAVSFLISGVQKYQALFEGFIALMERAAAFFDRLANFLEHSRQNSFLPHHMCRAIYQILGHFLKVLANSQRVANSRKEKWKMFAGVVMFADDGGVQADLDQMERLIQDLLHIEVDEILRDVKGIARHLRETEEVRKSYEAGIVQYMERSLAFMDRTDEGLETVSSSLQQMNLEREVRITQHRHESHLAKIQETLLVSKAADSEERQKKLRACRLAGTGQWLLQHPIFKKWYSAKDSELTLMTLIGQEGYGKSHLCSHVIDYILEMQGADQHSVVAYHFFGQSESGQLAMEQCLGSLVYQMAKFDRTYAEAAYLVCARDPSVGYAPEMWATLVKDLQGSMERTHYLVIDDASHSHLGLSATALLDDLLSASLDSGARGTLRMFISMTSPHTYQVHGARITLGNSSRAGWSQSQMRSLAFSEGTASVSRKISDAVNFKDLLIFAHTRIEELRSDPDFEALAKDADLNIVSTLVEGTAGDYSLLSTKLKEIEEADTDFAIRGVLSLAGEGRLQSLIRNLQELNESCTESDVAVLNELLLWYVDRNGIVDLRLLQSAVLLATGTKYRLRAKIAAKFSAIFTIDNQGYMHSVHSLSNLRKALSLEGEQDTQQGVISADDANRVQQILQANCQEELLERLDFNSLLNGKLRRRPQRLRLGTETEMHTRLLQRYLGASQAEDKRSEMRRLREHSWLKHLRGLDLETMSPNVIQEIAASFAHVLYDTRIIARAGYTQWNFQDEIRLPYSSIDALLKLLQMPSAKSGYNSEAAHHRWLREKVAEDGHPIRLFSRVILHAASKAMRAEADERDEWEFLDAEWTMTYVWRQGRRGRVVKNDFEEFQFGDSTPEDVDYLLDWIRAQVPLEFQDEGAWLKRKLHLHRAYEFSEALMFSEAAIRIISKCDASSYDVEGLRTIINAASSQRIHDQGVEAAKTLSLAKEMLKSFAINESGDTRERKSISRAVYEGIQQEIWYEEGRCYFLSGDREAAERHFLAVIKADAARQHTSGITTEERSFYSTSAVSGARDCLLSIFYVSRQWHEILNNVPVWFGRCASIQVSELAVRSQGNWQVLNLALVEAAWWTGRWREVKVWYEECVKKLPETRGTYNPKLLDIWLGLAILLIHCSDDAVDHETAISYWEKRVKEDDAADMTLLLFDERLCLSRWLLDKARAEAHVKDSSECSGFIQRLHDMYWCDEASSVFRLTLARFYITTGRENNARELLRPRLADLLSGLRSEKDWAQCYGKFACLGELLAAANDDLNAGAAYHCSAWIKAKHLEPGAIDYRKCRAWPKKIWLSKGDYYQCKDCGDVTLLCSACHQKVIEGEVPPMVCSKTHDHLYVPPLNLESWDALEPGHLFLNGRSVSFQRWEHDLRIDWKLDDNSIREQEEQQSKEIKASVSIGRWWKKKRPNRLEY